MDVQGACKHHAAFTTTITPKRISKKNKNKNKKSKGMATGQDGVWHDNNNDGPTLTTGHVADFSNSTLSNTFHFASMLTAYYGHVSAQNTTSQYLVVDLKLTKVEAIEAFVQNCDNQFEDWVSQQMEQLCMCMVLAAHSSPTGLLNFNGSFMSASDVINCYLGEHIIAQLKALHFLQKILFLLSCGYAIDDVRSLRSLQHLVSNDVFDTVVGFRAGFVLQEKVSSKVLNLVAEFGSATSTFDMQKKVFVEFSLAKDLGGLSINII
ncbi:hypothetical protein EWM64_g3789 [Hericium alpestre]|uniref:Uncharacterized protein n=1 Tax=Hericium alpestre TaxID=135208 RepID=A0A4Z0A0H0_9AGAM|nr:hypothetical protein EWM64_g3789 [Hericium alpestre]